MRLLPLLALLLLGCSGPRLEPDPEPQPQPPAIDPFLASLVPGTVPAPQPVTSPYPELPLSRFWMQPNADQRRSNRIGSAVPSSLPQITPYASTENDTYGPPARGDDGRSYILGESTLTILGADGGIDDIVDLGTEFAQWMSMGPDGNLYIADRESLTSVNADGETRWRAGLQAAYIPQFDDAGNVYIFGGPFVPGGTGGSMVYALDPNGEELWSYTAGTEVRGMAVDGDGLVAITLASAGARVVRNGALQWTAALSGYWAESPQFWPDGSVSFTTVNDWHSIGHESRHEYIEHFSPTGQQLALLSDIKGYSYTGHRVDRLGQAWVGWLKDYPEDGPVYVSVIRPSGMDHAELGNWIVLSLELATDSGVYISFPGNYNSGQLMHYGDEAQLLWSTPVNDPGDISADSAGGFMYRGYYTTRFDLAGNLAWTYTMPQWYCGLPVYDDSGNSYVASSWFIYSFDPHGNLRWRTVLETWDPASELLVGTGGLYVSGNKLYKLALDSGAVLWARSDQQAGWMHTQAIGVDGMHAGVGRYNRQLVATDTGDALLWTYTDENTIAGSPAIDAAGNIYFTTQIVHYQGQPYVDYMGVSNTPQPRLSSAYNPGDYHMVWDAGWLVSLDRSGALRFRTPLLGPASGSPMVSGQHVFCADLLGNVTSIRSVDGRVEWSVALDQSAGYALSDGDGALIVTQTRSDDLSSYQLESPEASSVFALDGGGSRLWQYTVNSPLLNRAATAAAGQIVLSYKSVEDGRTVVCLDPEGSELWQVEVGNYSDVVQHVLPGDGSVMFNTGNTLRRLPGNE